MVTKLSQTYHLRFWVKGKVVSRCVCPQIPNIGEVWKVDRECQLYRGEGALIAVRVFSKKVKSCFEDQIKPTYIDLYCEEVE